MIFVVLHYSNCLPSYKTTEPDTIGYQIQWQTGNKPHLKKAQQQLHYFSASCGLSSYFTVSFQTSFAYLVVYLLS